MTRPSSTLVDVALPLPLEQPLTYLWPDALLTTPSAGLRVLVPLGKRRVTGYVLQAFEKEERTTASGRKESIAYREVIALLDEEPLFGERELRFYRWIAEYYLSPLGEVLRAALPISMHQRSFKAIRILPRGIVSLREGVFMTGQELKLLGLLERKGTIADKDLRARMGKTVDRVIRSLEAKGCVEKCQLFKGRSQERPREERILECVPERSDPSLPYWMDGLPNEQTRILEILLEKGPEHEHTILDACKATERDLADLEENGLIRRRHFEGLSASSRTSHAPDMPAPTLTGPQDKAVCRVLSSLRQDRFHPFLLHGVTGSGKTEVYLRVIEASLKMGREALVLIPEIALTPQTVQRFSQRFGPIIAVHHSRLTERERLDSWWRIRRGQVKIVVGARSAVFAPFRHLGVIVVDEEHDPSYKQQERLRYHGRDAALVRGRMEQCVVILGSATPSLESYYNAQTGKSTLLELPERIEGRPHPQVLPVDMRDPLIKQDPRDSLSIPLEEAILETLKQGKKGLLFLNRRGYSHTLLCKECGHLFYCPRCSVSLTFHRSKKRLCCHYCEYQKPVPTQCPGCKGIDIQPVGRGTERIEEEVRALSTRVRVGRMDRDTTRRKGAHEQILRQFQGEETDILIGTQMIAKGHDIHEITLVGVVLADVTLDLPDFRASERTFHLLLQVAGRAGRGPWPGRVLIQTYHPDHYSIQAACNQDYKTFYDQEVAFRKELNYPPFSRLVNLRVTGQDEVKVEQAIERIARTARGIVEKAPARYKGMEVLGPSQAPLAKLRGRFRYHCFLKGSPPGTLLTLTRELLSRIRKSYASGSVHLEVDVDPVQVL